MRIWRSPRLKLGLFWSDLRDKIRDRRWMARFSLAVGALLALTVAAGIGYRLEIPQFIASRVRGWFTRGEIRENGLPTLHLQFGLGAYRALAMQRQRALQRGILLPDDVEWVPAQIQFEGETIPARVRLAGSEADGVHPTDHWPEKKWSLQVRALEDASLLGMRVFSLSSPATKQYLNGWLYVEGLRRAGILAPRYAFVNLSLNGEDWGLYALEEGFSREWLASQGRQAGPIVRLEASLLERGSGDAIAPGLELPTFAQIVELDSEEDRGDAALSEGAIAALGLLGAFESGQLTPSQCFDADLMGRYLAQADLWGARQNPMWQGERFHYDPSTARLEPIAWPRGSLARADVPFVGPAPYDDPAVMEAYAREALRISQPDYLQELRAAYRREFKRYHAALAQEFYPAYLEAPWDALAARQERLFAALHPPQTVYARWSGGEGHSLIELWVCNLTSYPVALRQLRVGKRSLEVGPDWVAEGEGTAHGASSLLHREALPSVVLRRREGDVPRCVSLRVPRDAIGVAADLGRAQVVTQLVGVEREIAVDVLPGYPSPPSTLALPAQPSVEDALERHPFLAAAERPDYLRLRSGSWHVAGDLVLPHSVGLWASEPVTLTFDRQAALFSSGPLVLHGPEGAGIHLLPQEDHWAGLIVLGTGTERTSWLYNVEIRGTRGIRRGDWAATGGVTFYGSPVVLYRCRLLEAYAQAAIHVVRSPFQFVQTEFGVASGDAFDGDLAQGRIERCAFHDVLGNAIDLSASDVEIQEVSLSRVNGEGLSASGGSTVRVRGVRATDTGIALASVDASAIRVRDVRIRQARTAGFAAYLKELRVGLASVEASEVVFEDDSLQALVQEGNRATINGVPVTAQALDMAELRRRPEAPPPMRPLKVRFGPAIWLVGYHLTTPELAPGDTVEVILYWRTFALLDRQYTVFMHVRDLSGETVAGWDMMPRYNTYPTTDWPLAERIDDAHIVPLPKDLPAGEYQVALGVYYWATGERLPAYTQDGVEIPEATVVLKETVTVK